MTDAALLIPQYGFDDWRDALRTREPRALELAYALALVLPASDETNALKEMTRAANDAAAFEIARDVRELLGYAVEKYEALTRGDFERVDAGNQNVLAFERRWNDERLLIVNNLARVSQPCKFSAYAGKEGWDILNRVEFIFPARAQLDAYEFLWLLVD